jgi:uncharacterized protein (TIGR02284 family)
MARRFRAGEFSPSSAVQGDAMSETSSMLPDLIDISREGTDFYERAAERVDDKALRSLFAQLAVAKSRLVEELASEVPTRRGRAKSADWVGVCRESYSALAKGIKRPQPEQIVQLEEVEGQLHDTFHKVQMDRDNPFVIRILAKEYLHKADALNKEMRARRRALE